MLRSLSLIVLGTSFVTMSSCCFTEQGNHAVRKMWCDYNTLRAPAFYLEQEDHLPYPAAQVGYYRWMYDKDPGHQLACLGQIPPRTCPPCDRVPAGNEPFEYEVYFPTALPRQSDQIWGNKLPEPINVPGGLNPSAQSNGAGGLAKVAPKNSLVPILPDEDVQSRIRRLVSSLAAKEARWLLDRDEARRPHRPRAENGAASRHRKGPPDHLPCAGRGHSVGLRRCSTQADRRRDIEGSRHFGQTASGAGIVWALEVAA